MQKSILAAAVASGLIVGLGGVTPALADYGDDPVLASVGEFELANGETKVIAHHKSDKEYRICVRHGRLSVPVKVIYDGNESTVTAGSCADFEAMDIRITPAGKLEKDAVLLGRYHYLSR